MDDETKRLLNRLEQHATCLAILRVALTAVDSAYSLHSTIDKVDGMEHVDDGIYDPIHQAYDNMCEFERYLSMRIALIRDQIGSKVEQEKDKDTPSPTMSEEVKK